MSDRVRVATGIDSAPDAGTRRWPQRLFAVLLGLGLCALVLYGYFSYGHGTQQCAVCGIEREAYCIGPCWVHSALSEEHRGEWRKAGIAICEAHAWARTGCWMMPDGIACYFGPRPPQE